MNSRFFKLNRDYPTSLFVLLCPSSGRKRKFCSCLFIITCSIKHETWHFHGLASCTRKVVVLLITTWTYCFFDVLVAFAVRRALSTRSLGMICKRQLCWQFMSPYMTYLPCLEEFSKWRPNTLYHTLLTNPPVVFPEFYYNEVVKTKLGFSWRLGSHRYSKLSYPGGTFSDIDCALIVPVPT